MTAYDLETLGKVLDELDSGMELFVPGHWVDDFVDADDMERDAKMFGTGAAHGCNMHKHTGHGGDHGYLFKKP